MIVALHIEYMAQWGAEIVVYTGAKLPVGSPSPANAIRLDNDGKGNWFTEVEAGFLADKPYHYALIHEERVVRVEWGKGHRLTMPADANYIPTLRVWNSWIEFPAEMAFHSPGFTKGVFCHACSTSDNQRRANTLTFRCEAPSISQEHTLAIIGNIDELGAWDPAHAVIMQPTELPYWQVSIGCDTLHYPIYYKFVLLDAQTHAFVAWEDRPNRYFEPSAFNPDDCMLIDGLYFANPLHNWSGIGMSIDLNALRSFDGAGIGEFTDLPKLIDWAKYVGMKVLCLQPVNDCGPTRETQRVVSGFALDIRYLSPEKAGLLTDDEKLKQYRHKRDIFNTQPRVRLSEIIALKGQYMADLFTQEGQITMEGAAYRLFWQDNKSWLEPYSEYMSKRSVAEEGCDEVLLPAAYFCFVQFHLAQQLKAVRDYARQQGILLMGTTPSGHFRQSADVEIYHQFFDLGLRKARSHIARDRQHRQVHPTYNWFALENNNYEWLSERLQTMSQYFDACYTDNMLGDELRKKNSLWQSVAQKAFEKMADKTSMLICETPEATKIGAKNWWEVRTEILKLLHANNSLLNLLTFDQWMQLAETPAQRPQTIEQLVSATGLTEIIKRIILINQ